MKTNEDKIGFTVTIPESLYNEITKAMEEEHRSRNQQVIHWIKLGKSVDSSPDIKMALQLREQLR